ncbi:VanZ family protein [Paenibacillus sp. CN-4]|uniref:VanZ family protein n=1 Tax=Paenibacillus nanchangensis TaxID=3348343 RepID=UPI00397E2C97
MIQSYLFPISYAFMAFPFAALLFTLPFLVVQYRRHAYINKVRAVVLYLLLLYLMNAFFLVILPLPASIHNPAPRGGTMQLIPFHFFEDILNETSAVRSDISTYWVVLKERAFLQIAFNVALSVPFGMFLRYYFRTGWPVGILLSFILSLFFEVTQLTGIYGIYDHPYRVFDVDDLISNTLGGIIGFLLAEWLSKHLPRIDKLDETIDRSAKRVTYTRRGLAFMFDFALWPPAAFILVQLGVPAAFWVVTGVYFMLIPWVWNGRTPGKWLVRIRLAGEDGRRIRLRELFIRYGILYWMIFGIHVLLMFYRNYVPRELLAILSMLLLAGDSVLFVYFVRKMFSRNSVLFYERVSRSAHAITWTESQHPAAPARDGEPQ